jgi:ankyrin repeat protein
MFPEAPDDGGYQPHPSTVDTLTVPVRCRGVWHRVGWRDGRVEPRDHTPEEAQRERVMRSLGGAVPQCFTVTETWQGQVSGRLPRDLRELRHHGLSAIAHGDTDELVRLLDLGVDPIGLRDRWGRGPLHHLAKVDGTAVLGRLLAAGLDINAADGKGRSPLGTVLFDGGSAALVRAMLDAGASVTAADEAGGTALHLLRSTDAAAIVPWLRAAGVELETRDEYGRTPLMTQVISAAPAEAIRATLAAGADPTATDEYTEQTIAEMVEYTGRDDLDFLVALSGKGADG